MGLNELIQRVDADGDVSMRLPVSGPDHGYPTLAGLGAFQVPLVPIDAGDRNALNRFLFEQMDLWIPRERPTLTDNFYGVNRSMDVTRLAGNRVVHYKSDTEFTAVMVAVELVLRMGGRPDHVVCSGVMAQTIFGDKTEVAAYGATLQVVPDDACQPDTIWVVLADSWALALDGKGKGNLTCRAPWANARVDP